MDNCKHTKQPVGFVKHSWLIVIIGLFGFVYLVSLTFVYVEGDDAASIVYHATGHRPDIGPYSHYHSMMDLVLGFLPANESLLRMSSIALTSVAAIGMIVFILMLAFDWLGEGNVQKKWLVSLAVILSAPEFLYFGLVYLPSVIALCLVLASHLILRRTIRLEGLEDNLSIWKRPLIIIATLLFAFGAACRWDITAYGAVIAADLIVGLPSGELYWKKPIRQRIVFGVSWGIAALVFPMIAIGISGYGLADVMKMGMDFLSRASGQSDNPVGISNSSVVEILVGLISYFTPVIILFGLVGFIKLLRQRSRFNGPLIVGIIIIIPWVISGAPKNLLAGIPVITTCAVAGFEYLWFGIKYPIVRLGCRVGIVACIIGMWLIGVQVKSNAAWGPGFEVKAFDRPQIVGTHYSLVIGPGTALTLPDGPRPLFGHVYVLLGGLWRNFVTDWSNEQDNAATTAITMGVPELRLDRQNPGLAVYVKLGYLISNSSSDSSLFGKWNFTNSSGGKATMLALYKQDTLYNKNGVEAILQNVNSNQVVVYGFPSMLRKLYELDPSALQKLGPTSAILDLRKLEQDVS